MKINLRNTDAHDLLYIVCDLGVRHWEDSKINGQYDDAENPQMPGIVVDEDGDTSWVICIDVETGRIKDWPSGTTADIRYKVYDYGVYSLVGADGLIDAVLNIVPDFLCLDAEGFGDHVIMQIDPEGCIKNWRSPSNKEIQKLTDTAL